MKLVGQAEIEQRVELIGLRGAAREAFAAMDDAICLLNRNEHKIPDLAEYYRLRGAMAGIEAALGERLPAKSRQGG